MHHQAAQHHEIQLHLSQIAALMIAILITNLVSILKSHYSKEPWHTSILTGQMWVMELLTGHPEHIHTELGVHHHVFYALIDELHEIGHSDSKYVTLEEQLAISLYCSVTGLTIRHLGEQFQSSNETISKWDFFLIISMYIYSEKDFFPQLFQEDDCNFFITTILYQVCEAAKCRWHYP